MASMDTVTVFDWPTEMVVYDMVRKYLQRNTLAVSKILLPFYRAEWIEWHSLVHVDANDVLI